jgi:hypothetical protein
VCVRVFECARVCGGYACVCGVRGGLCVRMVGMVCGVVCCGLSCVCVVCVCSV